MVKAAKSKGGDGAATGREALEQQIEADYAQALGEATERRDKRLKALDVLFPRERKARRRVVKRRKAEPMMPPDAKCDEDGADGETADEERPF